MEMKPKVALVSSPWLVGHIGRQGEEGAIGEGMAVDEDEFHGHE